MQEMQVQPLGREDPLEKEMATLFSIVAWEIPWTERRLAGYSPCSRKELDVTEQPNNKKSLKGHILLEKDEL